MVTAGVYLLMRSSPLIEYSSTVLMLCLWLGAITTVFSSLIGLFQQDIKKVVAYSTMSQLARIYNNIHPSVVELSHMHCGLIKIIINRIQAICVEFIFFRMNNSQVTKAHDYLNNNHISNKGFISHLLNYFCILKFRIRISLEKRKPLTKSRWVETSEAIRLILMFYFSQHICMKTITSHFIIYNYPSFPLPVWKIYSYSLLFLLVFYFNLIYLNLYSYICTQPPFIGWWGEGGLFNPAPGSIMELSFPLVPEKIRRSYYNRSSITPIAKTTRDPFFEWLAGVIDGVGVFNLTKKGIARLTIIMNIRDKKVLFDIRHQFGGSTHAIANGFALKYQISHKKGIIALLEAVNGLIRNPSKLLQMNKLCVKYNIVPIYPKPLTFHNGWLSGFIDCEGLVNINEVSGQVFISINQKNKYLLDPLVYLYGGRIKMSPKTEAFEYIIYRKNELFNLMDNYFIKFPLRTRKLNRINLIKEYYLKKISLNNKDVIKLNEWIKFKEIWDKFEKFKEPEAAANAKRLFPLNRNTGLVSLPRVKLRSQNSRGVRFYSVFSQKVKLVYDENFIEWFRGLVDGEASFIVRPQYIYAFKFTFQITLHIDDVKLLYFINESLGFGRVWIGKSVAVFKLESLEDIQKIIEIFRDRPLNTTKHLNFLDFKKAYELYSSNKNDDKMKLKQAIDNIIVYMNSKRSVFHPRPDNSKARITPYWLLGFVEGEGSFYISKSNKYSLGFNICQSNRDLTLMLEIKTYMLSLPGITNKNNDFIHLSITKAPNYKTFDMVYLKIYHLDYINNVLIPFLDSMKWQSKKELDYLDWKTIFKLKELGMHYTDEGVKLIDKIISQMNINRLSTNSKPKADRTFLLVCINKILRSGGSNFEIRNGRTFIKSLNKYYSDPKCVKVQLQDKDGKVIQTFDSLSSCGRFLGVYPATVKTWIVKKNEVIVDKRPYFICYVIIDND